MTISTRPPKSWDPGAPRRKILIVDDDEDAARLMAHVLGRDHHVAVAFDGEEGIAAAKADPPDLLLTDITMPRLDGVSMVRRLRAEGATYPVLFLSAHGDIDALVHAIDAGARGYLVKPVDLANLEERVRRALRS